MGQDTTNGKVGSVSFDYDLVTRVKMSQDWGILKGKFKLLEHRLAGIAPYEVDVLLREVSERFNNF